MNSAKYSFVILFLLFALSGIVYSQTSSYKVSDKIVIGGETRWDYLSIDKTNNHLFCSHGTKVNVVDLSTNKVIGEITDLTGVHGIEFVPELNKGYISNRDGQINVFDLKTLKKLSVIKIEGKNPNPDAILYDAFTKKVYTMNHSNGTVSAIDPVKDVVTGMAVIEGTAEAAVSDNNGRLFVNLEDKSAVSVIDLKTMKVLAKWSIAPVEGPTGMAIDLKTKRLFTVGDNKMAVLDITSGKLIAVVPIGGGCDGCAFDPSTGLIFTSNGEGNMTVIKEESPSSFKVVETVATQKGARTITIDERNHKVYMLAAFDTDQKDKDGKPVRNFGVLVLSPVK